MTDTLQDRRLCRLAEFDDSRRIAAVVAAVSAAALEVDAFTSVSESTSVSKKFICLQHLHFFGSLGVIKLYSEC